jgi:hypothetical protein
MEQAKPLEDPQSQDRRSVRSVIINWPMQREFTLITIAIMMLSAVALSFVIHLTLHQSIVSQIGRIGRVGAYNMLSDVSFDLIVRVIVVFFVTIVAVGMFGVFFLHRVAGPAFRFHQLFRRLGERGEIPHDIQLRERDFFKEIAAELNQVFRTLRDRNAALREVEQLVASLSDQDAPQTQRERLQKIRTVLQQVKISS